MEFSQFINIYGEFKHVIQGYLGEICAVYHFKDSHNPQNIYEICDLKNVENPENVKEIWVINLVITNNQIFHPFINVI